MKPILAILICSMLTGCGLRNFGMGPTPRQNVPLDEHPYSSQRAAISAPAALAVPIDEGCGACSTNSPIANPAFTQHLTASFNLPEQVNAFGLDESTDLVTWKTIYQETPHLWIGAGPKLIPFTTDKPFAYYRVWARNEP